jgi:hypothetical protein
MAAIFSSNKRLNWQAGKRTDEGQPAIGKVPMTAPIAKVRSFHLRPGMTSLNSNRTRGDIDHQRDQRGVENK